MDINSVPQDDSSTYANLKKAIYATDTDGRVQSVASTGWDVEEIATKVALDDIDESIKEAYNQVRSGEKSPLYYHMYAARMDLLVLAQSTGFFQWTIKRHFKPEVFAKLSEKKLLEYCDVLGINIGEIKVLPEADDE